MFSWLMRLTARASRRKRSRCSAMSESEQVAAEGFGHCTSVGECEATCPKGIPIAYIARMNRDFLKASIIDRSPGDAPIYQAKAQ